MAGMTIPLFTKRAFTFSATTTTPVVKAVDVSHYTEGALIVRVHGGTIDAGSIAVRARTTAPSPEDPAVDFVSTSNVAVVTLSTGLGSGDLGVGALSANFGGFLRVDVVGTYSSGTLSATLSAELVVKA
jgi:hypothetical protein